MKNKLVSMLIMLILLTGCQKNSKDNIVKRLENKIEDSSYKLEGTMTLYSNEEQYDYDINVTSNKGNYYIVSLINQSNTHEQIILKNDDGVYVITPSLNKSFKFQSKWPNNGSQSYILESILKDIQADDDKTIEEKNNNIIIKCKVDYPNNPDLSYQKIITNEDGLITKVTVYDTNDTEKIIVNINDIDFKTKINSEEFEIDNYINETEKENETNPSEETTSTEIDEIIYPLYIPNNTYLSSSDKIDIEEGNRAILTFSGEKDFIVVEQTSVINDDFEIIPVSGDPYILANTVAAISSNSAYFSNLGIDYYLASTELSTSELVSVASSLTSSVAVLKSK